jgi:hypothetical protein
MIGYASYVVSLLISGRYVIFTGMVLSFPIVMLPWGSTTKRFVWGTVVAEMPFILMIFLHAIGEFHYSPGQLTIANVLLLLGFVLCGVILGTMVSVLIRKLWSRYVRFPRTSAGR